MAKLPIPQPKFGLILKRIFVTIIVMVAIIAFLANAAGLVGLWMVRQPVQETVTALSKLVDEKLGKLDEALGKVSARAGEGRQAIARVNDAASKLGDRLEQNTPLLTALTSARDDLAPKIVELRAQVTALHDAAVSVNAALETLNNLGLVTVPTFTDEVSAVSEPADTIQDDVQELRARIDEARTVAPANLIVAVRTRTEKIANMMAQIQSIAAKYQTTVTQRREQVTNRARKLLRGINLLVLFSTALFLVVAAGQVLLIYVAGRSIVRAGTSHHSRRLNALQKIKV